MEFIQKLIASRDRTLPLFDLMEPMLNQTYQTGKWPVKVLLHHITDTETVYYDRIRRVLSEPGQVQWAFNQDAWASGLRYAQRPLALSRDLFGAIRACVIHEAEMHYESEAAARQFVHSEGGIRTLKSEFDRIVRHNEHHLAQIERALLHTV